MLLFVIRMDILHLCMQIWRTPYLRCSKISPAFHCFLFWIWKKLMSGSWYLCRLMTNGNISFEKKMMLPDDSIVVASGGHGLHFCTCTTKKPFQPWSCLVRLTFCPCDLPSPPGVNPGILHHDCVHILHLTNQIHHSTAIEYTYKHAIFPIYTTRPKPILVN